MSESLGHITCVKEYDTSVAIAILMLSHKIRHVASLAADWSLNSCSFVPFRRIKMLIHNLRSFYISFDDEVFLLCCDVNVVKTIGIVVV